MRRVFQRLKPGWPVVRLLLIVVPILLFIFSFFFWRLGSMTPGLGPGEYAARQNSYDVEQIITRGLDAPYYLTQHAFVGLLDDNVLALRISSVVVALIIFSFLFLLLRSWFGQTIALFAGLVFVTTPWVLLSARTATPNIMLLWPIASMACFILMSRSKQHAGLWWLFLCAVAAISLYTPGLIWIVLAAIAVISRPFLNITTRINNAYLISGAVIIMLLAAPLAFSLVLDPTRFRQLFLIPADWNSGLEILRSLGWSVASLFWQTRAAIDIGIDRLPVMNILQIALLTFGLYALSSKARNITFTLIGLLLFSIIVSAINDNPHLLIIGLPAVAIFIAAGLRFLYIEWRRVFPLNPFSYALAIGLISLVVGAHLLYAARYSLIAWPNTTETRSTYVLK